MSGVLRVSRSLVAATALTLLLAGCGDEAADPAPDPTTPMSSAPESAATEATGTPEERFLAQTAAHLCAVQSEVYPDQEALAEAYDSRPEFSGLDEAEVEQFSDRLRTDAGFSRELNALIVETCGS